MRDTFLKACRGIKTDYTPVWFMRQAGRYLPQYQKIRQKYDFLTMCRTPELAAEITMQPIEILNVDAAILFSDILVPLTGMGFQIEFIDEKGPQVRPTVRSSDELGSLNQFEAHRVNHVFETIRILTKELNVPLIGFAASPFTLATYVIEGSSSKDFINTKRFMFSEPKGFETLLKILTDMTLEYLKKQVEAGVHALQIFDTWAGILSPIDYKRFVYPYVKYLISQIKNVPVIYYCSNSAGLAEDLKNLEASVLSLDWRIEIEYACSLFSETPLQGNLDPLTLLGTEEEIIKRAEKILISAKKAKAHIFNLGHGININTSVDKLKRLVDFVHDFRKEEL